MSAVTRTPILLGGSGASVTRVTPEHGSSWIEKSGPSAEIALEAAILRWSVGRLPVARVLSEQPGTIRMSELAGRPLSEFDRWYGHSYGHVKPFGEPCVAR